MDVGISSAHNPGLMPPKVQAIFPDWWVELRISNRTRERLRALFTIGRDGYLIWYRGKTRLAAAKGVDPAEVEDVWEAKRKKIDAEVDRAPAPVDHTALLFREALSEFLARLEARVGAPKNPLAERTYHNYVKELNDFGAFLFEGRKIADTAIADIGPRHFSAYASTFGKWKASGFDSVVSRVSSLFRWAQDMEYLTRFRPGPDFVRPAKAELRDQRIDLTKSFTPKQVAKLYANANTTMRCWIALGVCAGFNNSDVAHVTRPVLGIDKGGVIDFRRRKKGKVRRVIPLPADVVELLKRYVRPKPAEAQWADYFFLTGEGRPFTQNFNAAGEFSPSNAVSRLFARLMEGRIPDVRGRNFSGLRTTFFNLAPRGEWELERKIIMGRAQGTIDLDSYLEDVGLDRLRHVVNHVWDQVRTEISKLSSERDDEARDTAGAGRHVSA